VAFTVTMTGTDANDASALSSGPAVVAGLVQDAAALSAGAWAFPPTVGQGQALLLTATVTNTGGARATAVAPTAPFVAGSGSVAYSAGPWPASSASLDPGESATWTWTYTGGTVGSADLTVTLTGLDGNGGWALAPARATAGPVTVTTAAALASAAAAWPLPVSEGQSFTVTLTVTNAGGVTANSVTPALANGSTAGLTPVSGPVPAGPQTLGPGAAATFTWVFTGATAGTVVLGLTATGVDSGTLGPLFTSGQVTGAVQVPAALAAAVAAIPATVGEGQVFLVTVTVTNTGEAVASGVSPSAPSIAGAGSASVNAGPFPSGPVALNGGQSVVFTWTMTAGTAGTVGFTFTLTGTDLNSGAPLSTGPATSAPSTVNPAAVLAAAAAVSPPVLSAGMSFTLTLTVTDTGGVGANSVFPGLVNSSTAPMTPVSGPVPAVPQSLIAGGAVTFTWVYATTGPGSLAFSLTATGSDAGSSAPLFASSILSAPSAVVAPAALAATASAVPGQLSTGQSFLVVVRATNTGGAPASSVAPATPLVDGAGGATPSAGPWPALVASLASGASVDFTWTMTAGTAGAAVFTTTVTGTDAYSAAPLSTGPVPAPFTVQVPASLTAAVSLSATSIQEGAPFMVVVEIGNSGGATASPVPLPALAFNGPAGSVVAAPSGFPAAVPGGTTLVFTWTVTAGAPGSLGFSLTVAGADANSAAPLSVLGSAPSDIAVYGAPALAITSVAVSVGAVTEGDTVVVTLIVRNPGSLPVTGVVPSMAASGTGGAVLTGGPSPASLASLASGASASFTFTYRASAPGSVVFTGGATASNAPSAAGVSSAALSVSARPVGGEPKDVVVGPHPFRPAQGGILTFSRIPASATVRVFTIAGEPVVRLVADGAGTAAWNGRNEAGAVVAPAVYIFVVEAPGRPKHVGKLEVGR
jgi:hypothetical protein